ncbi:MAG: hypothetical protein AAGA32_18685 [Pseudomonadota bacterium]
MATGADPGGLRARLRRLAGGELILLGALAVAAGLLLRAWWRTGGLFPGVIGLAVLAVAGMTFLAALRRAGFEGDGPAVGVVEIDEGRLLYLASDGGGWIARDMLVRVEIAVTAAGPVWRLTAPDARLEVPVDAGGAGGIADLVAGLEGARLDRAAAAIAQGHSALVWTATADLTLEQRGTPQ